MRVLSKLINILLVCLLLLMVFVVVKSKIKGEPPSFFGHQIYYVVSGSMEPTLHTGSIIIVNKRTNQTKLTPGEIITFKMPTNDKILVTHRIKEVFHKDDNDYFITKGDANPVHDPWILDKKSIVSVYSGITVPILGYLYQLIHLNFVMYMVCILLGMIFVFYGLEIIRKPKKNSKEF